MAFTFVEGGVCAAQGFSAGAVHAGIRKNHDKKDLALIFADRMCSAAAFSPLARIRRTSARRPGWISTGPV